MTTTERLRELYQEFEKSDGHSNEHAWAAIQIAELLPAMLAVIEAAEELADGVTCQNHCPANRGEACVCGMEALTSKVYDALAAFREVRE